MVKSDYWLLIIWLTYKHMVLYTHWHCNYRRSLSGAALPHNHNHNPLFIILRSHITMQRWWKLELMVLNTTVEVWRWSCTRPSGRVTTYWWPHGASTHRFVSTMKKAGLVLKMTRCHSMAQHRCSLWWHWRGVKGSHRDGLRACSPASCSRLPMVLALTGQH